LPLFSIVVGLLPPFIVTDATPMWPRALSLSRAALKHEPVGDFVVDDYVKRRLRLIAERLRALPTSPFV